VIGDSVDAASCGAADVPTIQIAGLMASLVESLPWSPLADLNASNGV
jgi:hypothetical protein